MGDLVEGVLGVDVDGFVEGGREDFPALVTGSVTGILDCVLILRGELV